MAEHETPPGAGEEEARSGPMFEWRKRKAEMLAKTRERRQFPTSDFELREAKDGVLRFSGYASVTEQPYEVGHFTETIRRGAFKRTLSESPDVQLLINHGEGGSGMPIARTGRNMTLTEDERGLKVEARLDADDPDVQLLARKMKNGLVDQMSFAFQATDQDWNEDYTERSIKAASIHRGDVSVVNQGANGGSTATIRSAEAVEQLRAFGAEACVRALNTPREERDDQAMEILMGMVNAIARDEEEAQAMVAELTAESPAEPGESEETAETVAEPKVAALRSRQRMHLVKTDQEKRAKALRRGK